jgi:hypothetical protein
MYIPGVNESQITNVLQDVDLCVSFPGKLCIQILKNKLHFFCEIEIYLKQGRHQK